MEESEPTGRRRLRLLDLMALMVGYGLAAVLVRGFWPTGDSTPPALAVGLALAYLWLGLAMSGPLVLLLDRRAAPGPRHQPIRRRVSDRDSPPEPTRPPKGNGLPSRYTRAELTWLWVGSYWLGMLAFVIPGKIHGMPLGTLALFQVVAVLGLTMMLFPRRIPSTAGSSWTHQAALGMIVTWPLAWLDMILLSRTLG